MVGYDLEKIRERQGPEPVSPVDCCKEFTFSVFEEATGGSGKQGRPARKQYFKRVKMMEIIGVVMEKDEQIWNLS